MSPLTTDKLKTAQKTQLGTGLFKTVSWIDPNTFVLGNSLGWFYIFDSRVSFKVHAQQNRQYSHLKRLTVSAYNSDNQLVAFGGNQSTVKVFDLRKSKQISQSIQTKFSKGLFTYSRYQPILH